MTPSPYINPYHLPGIPADKTLLPAQLKRAKKELMAEFELQEAAEIQIGKEKLGKSEVLAVFDALEDKEVRGFHKDLQERKALLSFLEAGDTDIFREKKHAELLADLEANEAFKDFVTPFYCYQFNQLFLQAFKDKDEDQIRLLFAHPFWVKIKDQQACYDGAYKQLNLEVENLKRLADSIEHGNKSPGPEVQEVADENWIHLLNSLPDPFDGLLNAYAKGLESLSLALFNTYQRAKLAKFVLRQGMKLRINTETQGRLQYVLDQVLKITPDDQFTLEDVQEAFESPKGGVKMWQWALGGLVVYLLMKMIF